MIQNAPTELSAQPQGDFALAMAVRKAGENSLARKIWRHAVRDETDNAILLAASQAAAVAEWHLASIDAANYLPQAHNLRFPLPYHDTISGNSDTFNLDHAFVYGLIRQESHFMSTIVSPAKAHGLMQVLPSTAQLVARKHGYHRYNHSRLTRVSTNVIIGTTYLADLAGRFKAHPVQVAAAYNAGPARAVRWDKRNRGRDLLIYIENIPILETRLYVKHVLANRAHYEARLGTTRASMRELIILPIRKV
jgi:soluble lytic murein transglycosylase